MIENITRVISLYDFYQDLLTDKQSAYVQSYYEDDLSLSEAAEKFSVSRNAIHDSLKRTVKQLEEYESKLHLLTKFNKKQELINEFKISKDSSILDQLEEL